ncbi:alpha/beta hydrolase [Chryseolinea sp. T2]|uniref:alpha/beta fold hydrolase n=1 Tax=Chryseolinea sp. T2 TaxID=3129255 RepID=UPI0030776B63
MTGRLLILLTIGLCACFDDTFYEGDFFYLVNKDAQMPVSVRGNISSGVLIVFLHGGPGGTALQKIGLKAFNELEKNYGMVFWDQRASGSSQGNSAISDLNLNQFTEDLDKLIDLLRYRYKNSKIFLMGHSWGGCLGTNYLLDPDRQVKITGWIDVDGAHDNPHGDDLSMQFVIEYANQQIARGSEVDFWQYVISWYAANPNFTTDQLEHYSFVDKAHGYIYDPSLADEKFPNYSFSYLFESPANLTASLTNYNSVIKNFIISDIDLTPRMNAIHVPSLIIWGAHDGIIPFPMAQEAFDALGTSVDQKRIVNLANSAHNGFHEEPSAFIEAVVTFVEENN